MRFCSVLLTTREAPPWAAFDGETASRLMASVSVRMQPPSSDSVARIVETALAEWARKTGRAMFTRDVCALIAGEGENIGVAMARLRLRTLVTYAEVSLRPRETPVLAEARTIVDGLGRAPRPVQIETIQKAVASFYGVETREMLGDCRAWRMARPRQVAMALARELTRCSLPDIGRRFGGRDHTTVLHAVKRVAELSETDALFAQGVAHLRCELGGANSGAHAGRRGP